MATLSQEERLHGLWRLQRLEQNLSRGILLMGMALLAVVAVSSERFPDLRWVLVVLAVMMAGKLLILVLGRQLAWKGWPALLLETLALGGAGFLASRGQLKFEPSEPAFMVSLLALAALMLGARFIRWRANRLLRLESDELERISST